MAACTGNPAISNVIAMQWLIQSSSVVESKGRRLLALLLSVSGASDCCEARVIVGALEP